jgi:hypothetical protein
VSLYDKHEFTIALAHAKYYQGQTPNNALPNNEEKERGFEGDISS